MEEEAPTLSRQTIPKMNTIQYIKGDATSPQTKGNKIIAHICNDIGGWGKGFVVAVSKKWPTPEESYRLWYKERAKNDFQLGAVQIVPVSETISVANMIGQRGIKSGKQGVPIRYAAVEGCLEKVAQFAKENEASIHMPRIGCGLAGGKWECIEPLILKAILNTKISVYVYDFD